MTSHKQGFLPFTSELSEKALQTNIFDTMSLSSLISLGKLTDDDCTVSMNKSILQVRKNNKVILLGYRNKDDGLWDIPLTPQQVHKTSAIAHKKTSKPIIS